MSPTGNLDFSPKPHSDQDTPATLQKRIPEDVAGFFFEPNDATPAKPIPPTAIYEEKAGVYSEAYRTPLILATTSTWDMKTLQKEKFTLTSTGNRIRFNILDMILRTNGLATMVDRDRTMPLPTQDDPLGYVPIRSTYINGEYTILSEDNIIKFD